MYEVNTPENMRDDRTPIQGRPRDERPACAGELMDSATKQILRGIDIVDKLLNNMTGGGCDPVESQSPDCFLSHVCQLDRLSGELVRRLEELRRILIG